MAFKKETDLAACVVSMLDEQGWTVYQEVQMRSHGGVADIVATKGSLVYVVECKRSMGLKVWAQANRWTRWANMVSVAVPHARRSWAEHEALHSILQHFGLGHIECTSGYDGKTHTGRQKTMPRLHRSANTKPLVSVLCPEMQTCAPAGSRGGHWTPYKATLRMLREVVASSPGATWKEVLHGLGGMHHYGTDSTCRSVLTRDIQMDLVPGVRLERDGKKWRLYPKEMKDGKDKSEAK